MKRAMGASCRRKGNAILEKSGEKTAQFNAKRGRWQKVILAAGAF
jgi:hypothetical protein